jgi:hypothetical protein
VLCGQRPLVGLHARFFVSDTQKRGLRAASHTSAPSQACAGVSPARTGGKAGAASQESGRAGLPTALARASDGVRAASPSVGASLSFLNKTKKKGRRRPLPDVGTPAFTHQSLARVTPSLEMGRDGRRAGGRRGARAAHAFGRRRPTDAPHAAGHFSDRLGGPPRPRPDPPPPAQRCAMAWPDHRPAAGMAGRSRTGVPPSRHAAEKVRAAGPLSSARGEAKFLARPLCSPPSLRPSPAAPPHLLPPHTATTHRHELVALPVGGDDKVAVRLQALGQVGGDEAARARDDDLELLARGVGQGGELGQGGGRHGCWFGRVGVGVCGKGEGDVRGVSAHRVFF